MFHLSETSEAKLIGVNPLLAGVVHRAIQLTTIDFGVIEGVRTLDRQRELYNAGASQTMKSKHLNGMAVDLMAYIGSRASWEVRLYDDIAEAVRKAAQERAVPVRWGGAWNVPNICAWEGTMEQAMNWYVDQSRQRGRRPFIDSPHFELVTT